MRCSSSKHSSEPVLFTWCVIHVTPGNSPTGSGGASKTQMPAVCWAQPSALVAVTVIFAIPAACAAVETDESVTDTDAVSSAEEIVVR